MDINEAIAKFREYWPDTSGTMWGGAFETICAKALESAPSASTNTASRVIALLNRLRDDYMLFEFDEIVYSTLSAEIDAVIAQLQA